MCSQFRQHFLNGGIDKTERESERKDPQAGPKNQALSVESKAYFLAHLMKALQLKFFGAISIANPDLLYP